MLNKRLIILISVIIGILIITSLVLWLLFKSPKEVTEVKDDSISEETDFEPITRLSDEDFLIFKLSDVATINPVISGGKVLYNSKQNGNILETDFEGKEIKTISNITVPNLINTLWSLDRSQVINIYEDGGEVKKTLFDIKSRKATSLDSRIKFLNFSQNDNRVIYQFIDDALGINKIAISDPNGLNWKNIFNIRMRDIRVYWPQENTLTIVTSPSGIVKGTAFTRDISDKSTELNKIIDAVYGLTIKYSPDGSRLLYSQTDQYGHNPSLYLLKNGTSENLNFNTLSEKCVFSKINNIYCAIPRTINGSLILPDDFYKNMANFSDIFFRVDSDGNVSAMIFDPVDFQYDFDVSNLQVSNNEDYLIFVNKKDGLLYSVKIK